MTTRRVIAFAHLEGRHPRHVRERRARSPASGKARLGPARRNRWNTRRSSAPGSVSILSLVRVITHLLLLFGNHYQLERFTNLRSDEIDELDS